jgi:hypothetical protein
VDKISRQFCFLLLINAGEVRYAIQFLPVVFLSSYLIQSVAGFQSKIVSGAHLRMLSKQID